jgi:hypothetical protein
MRSSLPWLCLLFCACTAAREQVPDAPSSAPAPVAAPTQAPPPEGPFGTAHPFIFQAAAPDGRWVVACQAREDTNGDGAVEVAYGYHGDTFGDALEPYLFLEPGEGQRLEDYVGADPRGRYVAVVREGALRLVDSHTRSELELTRLRPSGRAPGEDDAWVPMPLADFTPEGRHVLFLREEQGQVVAVVRELASGQERRLETGPGELRRAAFDPTGEWVLLQLLEEDTDRDGVLTWPQARTTLAPPRCRGPVAVSSFYGYSGDRPTRRLLRVEGGPAVEAEEVLQPVGPWLLRRGPAGELFVTRADGTQRAEWVPAACGATVLHVDTERQQLLVSCASGTGGLLPLALHGASVHQPLDVSVRAQQDRFFGEPRRLVHLNGAHFGTPPSAQETQGLVDLERRKALPLPPGTQSVVWTRGPYALLEQEVREGDQKRTHLGVYDVTTGQHTALGPAGDYSFLVAGDLVLYRGVLVDMDTGRKVSALDGAPHALDTHGRVLRPRAGKALQAGPRGAVPQGPVSWEPVLPPPSEP